MATFPGDTVQVEGEQDLVAPIPVSQMAIIAAAQASAAQAAASAAAVVTTAGNAMNPIVISLIFG